MGPAFRAVHLWIAVLVVAGLAKPPLAGGQSFDFVHVVRLGTVDGVGALAGEPRDVVRDGAGRYYMTEWRGGERVLVFSADGASTAEVGRFGEGPGEFRSATGLALDSSDSLWVVDRALGRTSVFTPDGAWARSFRTPGAEAVELGLGGVRVFSGSFVLEGLKVKRIAVHGGEEADLRPIGPVTELVPGRPLGRQPVAARREGGVWRAERNAYRFSAWTLEGDSVGGVSVDADGVPGADGRYDLASGASRGFLIHDLYELPTGSVRLLWSFDTPQRPYNYQYCLEDVAPDGTVVRSSPAPPQSFGFVAADLVYSYEEDEVGVPFVHVWRVEAREGAGRCGSVR